MKKSRSSNRCENPSNSISESLAGVELPQELIIVILLLLPVRSLLKFKCVSKSWLSLISSPQFIRSHLSTSNSRTDQLQVFYTTLGPNRGVNRFTLYSALYEPSANVSDIEIPFYKRGHVVWIIGIVNGLVCFLGDDGLYLWNPVLRKCKRFCGPNFRQLIGSNYIVDCFGYDESNDDYKVVFVEKSNRFSSDNKTEVEVYSLGTDSRSMSRIENFEGEFSFCDSGKYANGKIYWAASSSLSSRKWKIVSLDMASEKCGELQRPDYDAGVSGWVFGLSGGKLVVLYDYHDKKKADFWVMDKYGVEESWTKVVSIPYGNVHPSMTPYSLYGIVCILRNGEVVMSAGAGSLICLSKHKEFRKIMIGGNSCLQSHVYVESLVLP